MESKLNSIVEVQKELKQMLEKYEERTFSIERTAYQHKYARDTPQVSEKKNFYNLFKTWVKDQYSTPTGQLTEDQWIVVMEDASDTLNPSTEDDEANEHVHDDNDDQICEDNARSPGDHDGFYNFV
uniref:Uncharacterized protein n=1 Tax=Amphimedon queenslandica TaxID=400682 RepID=A0A1X7V4K2_AMPQE